MMTLDQTSKRVGTVASWRRASFLAGNPNLPPAGPAFFRSVLAEKKRTDREFYESLVDDVDQMQDSGKGIKRLAREMESNKVYSLKLLKMVKEILSEGFTGDQVIEAVDVLREVMS